MAKKWPFQNEIYAKFLVEKWPFQNEKSLGPSHDALSNNEPHGGRGVGQARPPPAPAPHEPYLTTVARPHRILERNPPFQPSLTAQFCPLGNPP